MAIQTMMPATQRECAAAAHKIYSDVKAIMTNPEARAEDKANVQEMIANAEAYKARAFQLKAIEDALADENLSRMLTKVAPGPDEEKDRAMPPGEFKKWGDFLYAAWQANDPRNRPDPRLGKRFEEEAPSDRKDMSGQTGQGGGYLIPAEFQATLLAVMGENSIVRGRATVIPMRRREYQIPVLNQTHTVVGEPHWYGGLKFYWAEEASAKTESDAEFRQVKLVAHKLIGFTRASNELMDDSAIPLDAFLSGPMGFAGGVAWMEDYAFLRGTGAGQPLGILPAPATINEPRFAAGTISYDDICDMMEDFLPSGRGVWIVSQSAMSELIQMNGPAGNPSYVWQPNAREGVPGYLMGFPVIWSEKMARIGQTGDILLADLKYYLVGDRQATTVESTQFEKWQYDLTSWRVVHRVDGQPWLSAPLTLQDGISQVSPFVILGQGQGS